MASVAARCPRPWLDSRPQNGRPAVHKSDFLERRKVVWDIEGGTCRADFPQAQTFAETIFSLENICTRIFLFFFTNQIFHNWRQILCSFVIDWRPVLEPLVPGCRSVLLIPNQARVATPEYVQLLQQLRLEVGQWKFQVFIKTETTVCLKRSIQNYKSKMSVCLSDENFEIFLVQCNMRQCLIEVQD